MENEKKIHYQLADFWENFSLEFLNTIIGSIGLTIVGILFELDKQIFKDKIHSQTLGWILLAVFSIAIILIFFLTIKKRKKKTELVKAHSDLSHKVQSLENDFETIYASNLELLNTSLAILSKKLNYNGSQRISIYQWKENEFYIFGRFCAITQYTSFQRKTYPKDEGFIGKLWSLPENELLIKNLPDPTNWSEYKREVKNQCNIPDETLKNISMKSRAYFLKIIINTNYERKAIVVFESINPDDLQEDNIKKELKFEEKRLLLLLDKLKINDTDLATQTGF